MPYCMIRQIQVCYQRLISLHRAIIYNQYLRICITLQIFSYHIIKKINNILNTVVNIIKKLVIEKLSIPWFLLQHNYHQFLEALRDSWQDMVPDIIYKQFEWIWNIQINKKLIRIQKKNFFFWFTAVWERSFLISFSINSSIIFIL